MDKKVIIVGMLLFAFVFIGMSGKPSEVAKQGVTANTQTTEIKTIPALGTINVASGTAVNQVQKEDVESIEDIRAIEKTNWEGLFLRSFGVKRDEPAYEELKIELNLSEEQINKFVDLVRVEDERDAYNKSAGYALRDMADSKYISGKKNLEKTYKELEDKLKKLPKVNRGTIMKILNNDENKYRQLYIWFLTQEELDSSNYIYEQNVSANLRSNYKTYLQKFDEKKMTSKVNASNRLFLNLYNNKLNTANSNYQIISEIVKKRTTTILELKKELAFTRHTISKDKKEKLEEIIAKIKTEKTLLDAEINSAIKDK